MPAVVAIPQVVEELLVQFGDFFPNEPARRHFAEYLTGLFIAEQKTVSGINREFAAPVPPLSQTRGLSGQRDAVQVAHRPVHRADRLDCLHRSEGATS
jgi:hypothetical protein